MPIPKKGSPEAKAWAADMRARREANKTTEQIVINPPVEDTDDLEAMKRRIAELEAYIKQPPTPIPLSQPAVNAQGKMTGTYEKYKLGAENYPTPVKRLVEEPRLSRFAFADNFELKFMVNQSTYTTIDGVRTAEPKFTLQLIRKMYDEDTGELTNKRHSVTQLIFHEDPETALVIANEVGYPVDEGNEKGFLDEMRYLRMRDWLLSCFYPEPAAAKSNKTEMVIGNKLVEVWEVSSESSESMDFSALKTKL